MTEIVFESNKGIVFERIIYKNNRVKLSVKDKSRNYAITHYRYKNAPGLPSPYLNWDNLNCCGGWHYDETYLYSAVQAGKKLYAGIAFHIDKSERTGQVMPFGFYSEREVIEQIEVMKRELPADCVLGQEQPDSDRYNSILRYIYICKKGAIHDYLSIDDVLSAYERLGITPDSSTVNRIKELCAAPISGYARSEYMDYANPKSAAELVVTGLLLGYPIETTASLLEK